MSIFRIDPTKSEKGFNSSMRISPNPRIYYPSSKDDIKPTSFYRAQTNKALLHLYAKHNSSGKQTYQVDKKYIDTLKIVIYTPPIDVNCGGIMVLYNLAKTINDLKKDNLQSYIYTYDHVTHPNSFCNNFYNPFLIDDNTIVIYPETIIGNPLGAKHVIRWILLDLGFEVSKNQYKMWDPDDIVYHWEPTQLKNSKQLVNIWVNPSIQKYNHTDTRPSNCYAFKKLHNVKFHEKITTYHNDKKDTNIDKLSIEETVKVFNNSSIFYCYDPNTFYAIMATLCGCVTVVHPLKDTSRDAYFQSRITCHPSGFCYDAGLAYGNSKQEIDKAKQSVNDANNQFSRLRSLWDSTVADFIGDVLQIVGDKSQIKNTVNNIYYT